jgi:hypothetical protein
MKKIIIGLVAIVFVLTSCIHNRIVCDKGSGKIEKHNIELSNFKTINLRNSANVHIIQGNEEKITIETDDNIFNNLTTEIEEGELILDNKNSICPTKLNYYITMKDIKGFKITGSGNINAKGPIISDDLFFKISGSGDVKFDSVNVTKVGVMILGSGDVKIKGKTEKFASEINGSGDIFAKSLVCDYAKIEINGSGDVRLNVSKEIKVEINGSGDVLYNGNPPNANIKIHGSGTVRNLDAGGY